MTVRTLCRFTVFLTAAILWATCLLSAGERTDIQGIGMARTFTASTRGLDAAGINPANLLDDRNGYVIQFGLPRVGMHVGSDFLTYDLYEKYFTGVPTDSGRIGRYLNDADKQEILNAFPDGVGTLAADAELRPVGVMVKLDFGALALTVTERVASSAAIPHQYAEFLFYGNTPGSVYDFSQTRAVASWTREHALTFATHLPDFAVFSNVTGGVGLKLVHGFAYAELDRFNTSLITGMSGVLTGTLDLHARTSRIDALGENYEGSYDPFPAPAGSGVGFDLGVAGSVTEYMRVGLSVTDIGSIRWTRNVRETTADSTIVVSDPLDPDQSSGIQDAVNGKEHPGADFTASLPTVLRMGVAVELDKLPFFMEFVPGELLVAADYNQGFAETAGSTLNPRFSLGMQWSPLPFLPLRTGVSFGGTDHYNWAIGFGFHLGLFDIDLASENVSWLFATKGTSYGSAAVGMRLNF